MVGCGYNRWEVQMKVNLILLAGAVFGVGYALLSALRAVGPTFEWGSNKKQDERDKCSSCRYRSTCQARSECVMALPS